METKYKTFQCVWSKIPITKQKWREKVGSKKIVVEIGPGVGLHPIRYAKENPDKFVIGIERTKVKYHKFARRVHNHGLPNLHAVWGDAIEWIATNLQQNEVQEYFVLYPNPYPKRSQRNKRIMHMPFMQYLLRTIKDGGKLTLCTDQEFFYKEALEAWSNHEKISCQTRIVPITSNPRTHFEKKYLAEHRVCREIQATVHHQTKK